MEENGRGVCVLFETILEYIPALSNAAWKEEIQWWEQYECLKHVGNTCRETEPKKFQAARHLASDGSHPSKACIEEKFEKAEVSKPFPAEQKEQQKLIGAE
ncbi:hypothetical protein Tcan_04883 [Toxocara canis]|uniref:Uncharacterized protein n=1 Tax=Toxocara canis TaxID=6265 RepID=A0A0B2W698_TOXCA|nr:hypothetical protein Tcan_04883 [Toxocara canis]